MSSKSLIEIADRKSRLRATLFAVATVVFVFVQIITHPVFDNEPYSRGWRLYAWTFNAVLLLACLGGGGGILNSTRLRALINDEVAVLHYRTACKAGFWIAMLIGLVIYVVPALASLNARQTCYLIVSVATTVALLTFSWLEYRAHADA